MIDTGIDAAHPELKGVLGGADAARRLGFALAARAAADHLAGLGEHRVLAVDAGQGTLAAGAAGAAQRGTALHGLPLGS